MKILHISLTLQGSDYVSLRYFWDNSNNYKEHTPPLAEIKELNKTAKIDYYTRVPVDYVTTGKALYDWLDKSDRLLANALNQNHQEGLILAISTDKGLARLPWELLHDGKSFLVEKMPPIIPLRWVSKQQKTIEITNLPPNRPLNLLFMATSPLAVEPVLDYEAEEGQILEATKRIPLNLRVEESGCLQELRYLVQEYDKNYFDVFHLTGHATYKDQKPCFLTEDEYGNCVYSNSRDIADTFNFSLPSLIFLSGCRTGYASDDDIPSMAEELLNMGAKAVLGWGERVLDTEASTTSRKIYGELSAGKTITQALAITYQALIKENARDWHKLRLYLGNTLPQALVTPLRTPRRQQLLKPIITTEFRDDENRLRVASREEFVGRRRQLQNCLRTLRTDYEKVGVLIHGMGGWGKSSIASRLWDRLPDYEKALWWRQVDEFSLIKKLSSKLIKPELREIRTVLAANDDGLEVKLAYLFSQLAELGEKSFLLILDDFEWNLEPRDGGYILKPEVTPILDALVRSIQETGTENKIIITCRYNFDSDLLDYFYKQGLEPFRKSELTKKLNRLKNFNSDKISENLRERALILADGNPRLLEFLNSEVLGEQDAEAKLTELEESPELWKNKIIWEELYQLIDERLQQVLSHCLVYEIPVVPMSALEVVCESLPNYKQQLQRGLDLGLIEMSSEPKEEDRVYRVSRILPHIIANIKLPEAPDVYGLYRKASEFLYQLWGKQENRSEEKWQEIFRLLFADKGNSDRFRQGFSWMLAVQDNAIADRIYEIELRKLKDELSEENIYWKLEYYLCQHNWRKADEETAFIFYQVMIFGQDIDHSIRYDEIDLQLLSKILKEIDALWVRYSNGYFGFSVQKKILEGLELEIKQVERLHHPMVGDGLAWDRWESSKEVTKMRKTVRKFREILGWDKKYKKIKFTKAEPMGNLPVLWTTCQRFTKRAELWESGDGETWAERGGPTVTRYRRWESYRQLEYAVWFYRGFHNFE